MYLSASKYIGGWDHSRPEETDMYRKVLNTVGKDKWKCEGSPSLTVQINVMYWRKANQIHNWFVQEVQDGVDNCSDYYVSRAQLEELRDLCQEVIDRTELKPGKVHTGTQWDDKGQHEMYEDGQVAVSSAVAEELLPTGAGFFFGSTDYDSFYFDDLKHTVEGINKVLSEFDGSWDFEYNSSW